MSEYLGNVVSEILTALEKGHSGITLNRAQMEWLVARDAQHVEHANSLVRENHAIRFPGLIAVMNGEIVRIGMEN